MAKGITLEADKNHRGEDVYLIKKSRGKLSLDEITEFLQNENYGEYQGQYIILLNATESAMGGSGWETFGEECKGDMVELILLTGEGVCPICDSMLPPDYCPKCGISLAKYS